MRWLLVAALLIPGLAQADSLLLTNGASYVGRLVEEGPVAVTISSAGAVWTFKRDRVATINHDAAEADREEAQTRDRLQEAANEHARRLQQEADRKRAYAEENVRSWVKPAPPPPVVVEPVQRVVHCRSRVCGVVSWPASGEVTLQRPEPRIDYRWFN